MASFAKNIEVDDNKNLLFWRFYFYFYDVLNHFEPYKQLLSDGIGLLDVKPEKHYFDAGCGTGNSTIEIIKNGGLAIGVDFSKAGLNIARKKYPQNIFYYADLNSRIEFPDNYFDGVYSNNVLYSLSSPERTINEFYRILKPGGRIVLSTPKQVGSNLTKLLFDHLQKKGSFHTLSILPRITMLGLLASTFLKQGRQNGLYHEFTEDKLTDLLEKSNFKRIGIKHSYANHNLIAAGEKIA